MVKNPENKSGKKKPSSAPARASVKEENEDKKGESKGTGQGPWTPTDETIEAPAKETPASPQSTPVQRSGSSFSLLWGLALLAILFGGGYATLPLWKVYVPDLNKIAQDEPQAPAPASLAQEMTRLDQSGETTQDVEREREALSSTLNALIERLDSVEQQLTDVRKMVDATALPDEVASANKSLQQLSGRLMKIEESNEAVGTVLTRLTRLEKDIADAANAPVEPPAEMTAAIGKISERLNTLETGGANRSRLTSEQSNAQALVLAVGQLRQTLPSGAPYSMDLQTLLRLGGNDPEIAKLAAELEAHAGTGVSSLKSLSRSYDELVDEITASAPDAEQGFFAQTLARLTSLVRVRRLEDADGDATSVEGMAARAAQALADGDLQAALTILQGVPNASAGVQEWIGQAQTRLDAERALALLNVYAVSLLAPATE